jgi:hypothetical protein
MAAILGYTVIVPTLAITLQTVFRNNGSSGKRGSLVLERNEFPTAYKAHPLDTVATMLDDAAPGIVQVVDSEGETAIITVTQTIERGHKAALVPMVAGDAVVKYGTVIGRASRVIAEGDWVHLHNCASGFDERSSTLDIKTGAPSDTQYG